MHVLKRRRPGEAPAFFAGLGGVPKGFSSPKWVSNSGDAEQFDTSRDAIDHAKLIFPQLLRRKQIEAVEVPDDTP